MSDQVAEVNAGYLAEAKKTVPVGYKQTEVGVIPEDWEVTSLQDVAVFGGGTTPPRKNHEKYYVSGLHPWVKTLDLNNSLISVTEEYVTDAALAETSLKKQPAGSVLIAMYGGFNQIGRSGLIAIDAAINQALVAVIPRRGKLVSEYMLYNFNYKVEYWKGVASSSRKDPNITSNDVKNYLLPLPAVKEQTAIANALSDVDALISELEKLIAKKQAIKTATMQQLLTGRTRLPQFALREDGTPKGTKPSELGEIPEDWDVFSLLDIANLVHGKAHEPYVVESGKYVVVNSKFVSTEGKVRKYCSQNDCAAKRGDILMVLSDLPNGKALAKCFYADMDDVYAVNQRVCIFRTSVFDSKYLQLILNRHKYFLALDDGVTQTHILNGDIAACQLFTPVDREEQTAIATILSDMDAEIQALEQRLGKTRQIKQGMMQELLTGKTRLVQPSLTDVCHAD